MLSGNLGPYRIERELGAGGMGTVYAALVEGRCPGLAAGTRVALKIVHPHLLETPGFFKRFLREAQLGKSVVHENVVRTIDADATSSGGVQQHFLVMEYVEGRTLRELLTELERVPEELCRHIGHEVAKGLAAIHAAGVVHRDIKPENVLITRDHAVKVMDLGVARLADEVVRLSQSGVFVGSIEYAAPEQFGLVRAAGANEDIPRSREGAALSAKGDAVDGRADLHALGLILYELATGQHPYRADDFRAVMRKVLDEEPRRAAEINPQLSPFFEELVAQLLRKEREKRLGPAAEIARILDEGERSSWWGERARSIRVETRRPLRRMRIPRETALYGREAELARLRALFERATAGEGLVALIEGEAGIGKSRLVDEFAGLLQQSGEDVNFLYGSYPPGGAATASGAFSTAYREQFGEEGSSAYLTQTPALVPAFDALLRGETTPRGVEPLTKDSLQTVFVHATRSLAAERPTIVLIDDLHFAPEEGRALFAALAMAAPGHRILLVGTTRPGLDGKWLSSLDRVGTERLPVARLGPKDLVRLLVDTLQSDRLAEELVGKIALKSDGNPFFVFEILRGLRDGQFITRRDDGTWATTRLIEEIQIPSSVLELVQARVADLSRDERNALDVAACLGFEFDPALVANVLGVGRIPLLQGLAHVEKAHRLVRSAGRRFVFDHHQVQEALYAGLPEMLREEYHAAIGEALEPREGARSLDSSGLDGGLCVELAEHLLKGRRGAAALPYLDAALTHLESGHLNEAAVRLADRALASPGLLQGAARAQVLVRKAGRLDVLGRRDAHRVALDEALALAASLGDEALRGQLLQSLGWLLFLVARYDEAETVLRQALEVARAAGDRATAAVAEGNLGSVVAKLGRTSEAEAQFERQIALARELGDRRLEAIGIGRIGNLRRVWGRFAEAETLMRRQLDVAKEMGDIGEEMTAAANLGIVLALLRRPTESRDHYERALALARQLGHRQTEADVHLNLGSLEQDRGHYGAALALYERHVELAREVADREGEAIAMQNLGNLMRYLGRISEARARCKEALEIHPAAGDRRFRSMVLQVLAHAVREEDAAAAEPIYGEALAIRRELGYRFGEAMTLRARGVLRARLGRTEDARADLVAALAIARDLSIAGTELVVSADLAALDPDDPAAAASAVRRSLPALSPRSGPEEVMEARFLLWRAAGDASDLRDARRILDELVAHAPPGCRESMLANVRLHREIVAAVASQGL